MASKLELRFKSPGVAGEQYPVKTGVTYTFKETRSGYREVGITDPHLALATHFAVAMNFKQAYEQDDNYLGQSTLSLTETTTDATGAALPEGTTHWLLTIENFDNDFFNGYGAGTSFMDATLTTTAQEVASTLDVSVVAAANPCANYKVQITTNVVGKKILVSTDIYGGAYEYLTSNGGIQEVEFVRPPQARTGRVQLFENESDTFPIVDVLFNAPPVLSITSVEVEGSPFGAIATINATQGLNKQYSLDNITYQGSNTSTTLPAGNYTAYVKDDFGCVKTRAFTVTEEQTKGLTAPPMIRVPVNNSIHFVKRGGNSLMNYLSTEMPGYIQIRQFKQFYLQNDLVRTQFKSSYPVNKAFLIDENKNETELTVIQKSDDNINRVNIYEGNYMDKNGRVAVYFTSGNIYNKDGSVKPEGHNLNGLLPDWYEEGMYIMIEGIGVTRIDQILADEDGITYAITQTDAQGSAVGMEITSIHMAHPYEMYEFDTNFDTEGTFQIRIDYGAGFFLSELIQVHAALPETYLLVQWWSETNNDIVYNTGIKHFRRLEWEKYFSLKPKGEKETYDTDTDVELINTKTFAVYNLVFEALPMEVARGLQTAFDHADTILINGAKFISEPLVELKELGQWYYASADLTLVDQTIEGQQEIYDAVAPEFLALEVNPDGVVFLRL